LCISSAVDTPMNGSKRYKEKRCESVAGCGYGVNGERYSTSFTTISSAMTIDWATSMPLMPARILILFEEKMDMSAI
jgi:hypothetical protein